MVTPNERELEIAKEYFPKMPGAFINGQAEFLAIYRNEIESNLQEQLRVAVEALGKVVDLKNDRQLYDARCIAIDALDALEQLKGK